MVKVNKSLLSAVTTSVWALQACVNLADLITFYIDDCRITPNQCILKCSYYVVLFIVFVASDDPGPP